MKAPPASTIRISHEASDGSALMRLRKAAPRGTRGKELIEGDDLRTPSRDRLERLECVGIHEGFSVGEIGVLPQRGEVFGCRNQDRG